MIAQKAKKRGPAPTGKGHQVVVRLQPDMLEAVDTYVAGQGDDPSRPEAIRRILALHFSESEDSTDVPD